MLTQISDNLFRKQQILELLEMRISEIRMKSDFAREIGLIQEEADGVTYVPEVLTASDNVDLIYEKLSQSKFKNNVQTMGKQISKITLLICVSIVYHFIANYFISEDHSFREANMRSFQGYVLETIQPLTEIFPEDDIF